MEEKLKPCPFCGSVAEIKHTLHFGYFVECQGCKLTTANFYDNKYDASMYWNHRV